MARSSILADFDESLCEATRFISSSVPSLNENDLNNRFSRVTYSSDCNPEVLDLDTKLEEMQEETTISRLTLKAMRHYKRHHESNFKQSQIEETIYEAGFFASSERLVQLLARILRIGKEPEKHSTFYQPIAFSCSSETSRTFILELFSRAMWLLSKTRREMKVSTLSDYPKVLNVLEQQIKLVLLKKPKDFGSLTNELSQISFDKVLQHWEQEAEDKLSILIETNPSIRELRRRISKQIEPLIVEHRMVFLLQGQTFPKIKDKTIKKNELMFVKLSENRKQLLITERFPKTNFHEQTTISYEIENITHIATEKNCEHANLDPSRVFSLIVQHTERIHFLAKDELEASRWIDAFYFLMNREERSSEFTKDLNTLVDMDVRLKLIELQHIKIPSHPPSIPAYPPEARPALPPKPLLKN